MSKNDEVVKKGVARQGNAGAGIPDAATRAGLRSRIFARRAGGGVRNSRRHRIAGFGDDDFRAGVTAFHRNGGNLSTCQVKP